MFNFIASKPMLVPLAQHRRITWLTRLIVESVVDTLYLLPAATFIFISAIPVQALAFANYIELSQQPLQFVRDPSLSGVAIVGIEAFPRQATAGQLLRNRTSRIPEVSQSVSVGTVVRVMATAYSSTVDQTDGDPFTTASGARVQPGTLATNFLPFGTIVRIGSNQYTVHDRMNSRYNDKYIVDVWQPSRAEAIQFGVRVVEMEVVSLP